VRVELAAPAAAGWARWLLVRRSRADGELAFYHCWTPRPVALATLARVAGRRWTIEMCQPQCTHICGRAA
jgi:hypothetical protein